MPKRKFTREFKESAAKLVSEQGYTAAEAAKSLGVDPNSIRNWVKQFPGNGSGAAGGEGALRAEVRRLREENKRLLMEREILPLEMSISRAHFFILLSRGDLVLRRFAFAEISTAFVNLLDVVDHTQ